MDQYTDEQLMARALKKDDKALAALVKRYLKLVYSFTYQYARNNDDAEDLTQEVFVKVWQNLKKFDQAKKFRPWLYQIAKNTGLDFLKKKKAIPFSDLEAGGSLNWLENKPPLADNKLEELADISLLKDKLALAVNKLTPNYAEIVSLHNGLGLNFRQISEQKKEPINTIKSRYRRALSRLKKIIS